jgi:hypothetical protein
MLQPFFTVLHAELTRMCPGPETDSDVPGSRNGLGCARVLSYHPFSASLHGSACVHPALGELQGQPVSQAEPAAPASVCWSLHPETVTALTMEFSKQ